MLKASIIITAFNSENDLLNCILALERQTRKDFEIIIVNNDICPIGMEIQLKSSGWLRIINSPMNTGFSGGSNIGAKGSKSEWIITLNPDACPHDDWFFNLMQGADNNPNFNMLSSTLISANCPDILDGVGDHYSIFGIPWRMGQGKNITLLPDSNRCVLAPCGAAAAYRRKVFEKNSGFDEEYFCYLEDLDLALRFQSQGHRCIHVADAKVNHIGGGSTGVNSSFQLYYSHRNQVRLITKLTPNLILFFQIPLFILTQLYLLARNYNCLNMSSRIMGLKDGFLSVPKIIPVRRQAQASRKISIFEYAKLISWSIRHVRNKSIL